MCIREKDEQKKRNDKINRELSVVKHRAYKEKKILLLGSGECGKSTFIKQMKILHGGGYSLEERIRYKKVIHNNVLQAIVEISNGMHSNGIPFHDQRLEQEALLLSDLYRPLMLPDILDPYTCDVIKRMWADPGMKYCFETRSDYVCLDSARYFLDRLDVIFTDSVPEVQDILRSRVVTRSIHEEVFGLGRVNLRIIDVGGQRKERRKWIHCFEGVTSVIFLASLSEFDQCLVEDSTKNRHAESLQLFKIILEYPWFQTSSIILFLNKKDIFEEKIATKRLADYLPNYNGPEHDVEATQTYMSHRFKRMYKETRSTLDSDERFYRFHYTCATDTQNIRKVVEGVKDTIIGKNIDAIGL